MKIDAEVLSRGAARLTPGIRVATEDLNRYGSVVYSVVALVTIVAHGDDP